MVGGALSGILPPLPALAQSSMDEPVMTETRRDRWFARGVAP
jgi:hypothetical protein